MEIVISYKFKRDLGWFTYELKFIVKVLIQKWKILGSILATLQVTLARSTSCRCMAKSIWNYRATLDSKLRKSRLKKKFRALEKMVKTGPISKTKGRQSNQFRRPNKIYKIAPLLTKWSLCFQLDRGRRHPPEKTESCRKAQIIRLLSRLKT